MPIVSSYALQYSNVDFNAISASSLDLFITEGAPLAPGGGFPALSDAQVAALTAQGRLVVGYINVAVTDDTRYYWNASWTTNGRDTGTPDGDAPSWLQGASGIDFTGDGVQDALRVNFADTAWQDIVIAQAVALVQRGYSGVFLDDVAQYFPGSEATVRLRATQMAEFVIRINNAITAINPNAFLVVNSDPYLHTNVTNDARGAAAAAGYLAAVDAHVLENQSAQFIDYAVTSLAGETRLILESDGSPAFSFADSWTRGILYTAPNQSYNTLGSSAYPATAGADMLTGGNGPNQIAGLAGNDTLDGGAGADRLDGGGDNDLLIGGLGADVLIGGAGIDTASYQDNQGAVFVNLTLGQGSGNAAQGDTYSGIENVIGSLFDDTIIGDGVANRLDGAAGNDVLIGAIGADVLVGGDGVDFASYEDNQGAVFVNLMSGQGFNNAAQGDTYSGIENLRGSIFADYFIGSNGTNRLEGGNGNDVLLGGLGADVLDGGAGLDTASYEDNQGAVIANLTSGQGFGNAAQGDTFISIENLVGSVYYDTLVGDANANRLDGARGADTLTGAGGADLFVFATALDGTTNVDTITDFVSGTDRIELNRAVFAALGAGMLSATAFTTGTAATTATQRIIYDPATGNLFYDADGSGAGGAVLFATLQTHPTISANDFVVV